MPTYGYRCLKCKNEFEKDQKITDDPIKQCPSCDGGVIRLISGGVGVVFKGSGFYCKDNKKPTEKL